MDISIMQAALDGFQARLDTVTASQWGDPTPCAEWDVRALVNHVVGEVLWMPPLLEGQTIADVGDSLDGDILGDEPAARGRAAAASVMHVASLDGAQERIVHLSFGDVPGGEYLSQVAADLAIHTWDLSRGIGGDEEIDPTVLDFADTYLRSQMELWRAGGAFGPPAEAPDGASKLVLLLAETGRTA